MPKCPMLWMSADMFIPSLDTGTVYDLNAANPQQGEEKKNEEGVPIEKANRFGSEN
jgi:hypothetical protein